MTGTQSESNPRMLDLYCRAGGAAMGYYRAGFDVVGVDNEPQPHYPFEFHQADALTFPLDGFDAYHASPPCQKFSTITQQHGRDIANLHPDLIGPTREMLIATGKPYIIENVPGSPLINPVMLCGTMFNLGSRLFRLRRHRLFECNFTFWPPATCNHQGLALGVYGHPGGSSNRDCLQFANFNDWKTGMDIDWMNVDELAQAIPPAYTEHIGGYLMDHIC